MPENFAEEFYRGMFMKKYTEELYQKTLPKNFAEESNEE